MGGDGWLKTHCYYYVSDVNRYTCIIHKAIAGVYNKRAEVDKIISEQKGHQMIKLHSHLQDK